MFSSKLNLPVLQGRKGIGEKTKIVHVGKLKVGKTPTKYILRQNKANLVVKNTKMRL